MVISSPDQRQVRRRLRQVTYGIMAALGLPLIALLVLLAYLFSAAYWTEHTSQVLAQASEVEKLVLNMDSSQRGYLLANEPRLLEAYELAAPRLEGKIARLISLVSDNPHQTHAVAELHNAITRWRTHFESVVRRLPAGTEPSRDPALHLQDKAHVDEIRSLTENFVAGENRLMAQRSYQLWLVRQALLGAVLFTLLILLPYGLWRLTKRLRELHDTYQASMLTNLRQAEQIHVTLRSIGDAVIATDPEGRVDFLNPVAETLLGWTNHEAKGLFLTEVFPIFNETTGKPTENPVERVLKERIVVGLANHTILRARDGTERPIEDSAAPILAEDGTLFGVILVFHDVTEKRQTEKHLFESESRYRMLVELSPQIVWMTSQDGSVTYVNDRWQQYTGMAPPNTPRSHWLHAVHPDYRVSLIRTWRKSYADGQKWQEEVLLRRAGGDYRWHLAQGLPLKDEQGRITRWMGIAVDIQDQKETEAALRHSDERLRLAVAASSLGTWDYSPLTEELRWDERCKECFGLPPDAHIDYAVFLAGLHPDDRARADRAVRAALSPSGEGLFDMHYRTVGLENGGMLRWIRATGKSVFNEKREAIRFIGTVQDITALKKHDEELRNARDQAEAASRSKDNFLAALSHELRTPLTPVLMTTASLADDPRLPSDVREQLTAAQRNIELEARLIDDLLDLTRISQGRLSLRLQPCDSHSLLLFALDIVRDEAQAKNQTLDLDFDSQRPLVTGDPARLQQLFWNLIRNAVKFTPVGGRISIRTSDLPGDRLAVTIQDSGIGIAPDALERIFKPFEQAGAGPEHQHRFGGLGLGLAIARAIAELHRGSLRAESAGSGQGASFTIELPDTTELPPPSKRLHDGAPSQPSTLESDARLQKLRLLLVEDHKPTLEVLSRLLDRAGHHVTTASSVQAGLEAVSQHTFDGVISDLGLPDGSGLDLMRELKSRYNLRGIALSGYGMEEDLIHSQEAGFLNHLVKPVNFTQLRHALLDFIKSRDS